jgi:hypothetical protein
MSSGRQRDDKHRAVPCFALPSAEIPRPAGIGRNNPVRLPEKQNDDGGWPVLPATI